MVRPAWSSLFLSPDGRAEGGPNWSTKLAGKLPGWLGWGAYTLGCFIVFVVWTFPTQVILDRAVVSLADTAEVYMDYQHGTIVWPGQAVFHEVAMTSPSWAAFPSLQLSRLAVTPSLLGMVRNSPLPLRLEVSGYGGEGWATIDQIADKVSVEFMLRRLELGRLLLSPVQEKSLIDGHLTLEGSVEGKPQDLFTLSGPVTMQISDGAVPENTFQGIRLPALQTLAANFEVEFSQGQVLVHSATLVTDGVEARVQGTIRLKTPLSESRLNLELQVKKTGTPPPALASLISLLPGSATAGGRASMRGVLGAPRVRSVR